MDGKVSIREKIVLGFLVLLLVTGVIWRSGLLMSSESEVIQSGFIEQAAPEESEQELITVHLVGAVKNPGIYQLPVGSRVYELLDICGGCNEEADQEALNLARPLLDGEQIYIQKIGETPEYLPVSNPAKININQASVLELTALPGIGEMRAGQIVAHRDKYGFFKDIREIMDVSGIGDKTFESIAELITIY